MEDRGDAQADYLRIEGASKRFGETLAVASVALAVREREIFALLGASGCGKSTLLRLVAGLETPTTGRIVLDGEDLSALPPHRRPTNMMFQSYALFPHLTVAANVAFGLRQIRPHMAPKQIAERVDEMLDLVQMQAYAGRRPHELSGGQQQRAALARSLARHPKLLLLDEPLSALDKKIRQRTQLELVRLIQRVGVTCILVTHDQEEAMTMADRIGVMSPKGELLQVGTPDEVYGQPACRYTAQFIGETNLFGGRVTGGQLRCDDFPAPLALAEAGRPADGSEAWLSVRPERVRLSRTPVDKTDNQASGTVDNIAYLGSHSDYHVRLAGGRTLIASVPCARWGEDTAPVRGDAVWLSWAAPDGVVLTR
jgi:putrescine transport system ATP-binding protein